MEPHPDFANATIPRTVALKSCQMTPLAPRNVDEDFAVVMESAHLLSKGPGDWPDGLTLADNAIDLAWHEREFTTNRSFAWILRDAAGTYLGCFYIYPDLGKRGSAKVVLWIRARPDRDSLAATLRSELATWTTQSLPAGTRTHWHCNPAV